MVIKYCSASPEEDIANISALVPEQYGLVRIDGHSGVGKSRLSRALAKLRRWQLIEVDRLIIRERPSRKYVVKVDRGMLHDEVRNALKTGAVIVDGLCLDHLLPISEFGRGFRIYVRSEEYAASLSDELDRRQQLGTVLYHRMYDPEGSADLVLTVPYEM